MTNTDKHLIVTTALRKLRAELRDERQTRQVEAITAMLVDLPVATHARLYDLIKGQEA